MCSCQSRKDSKGLKKVNDDWDDLSTPYNTRSKVKKVHFNKNISAQYFEVIPREMVKRGRKMKGFSMVRTSVHYPSKIRNKDIEEAVPFKINTTQQKNKYLLASDIARDFASGVLPIPIN